MYIFFLLLLKFKLLYTASFLKYIKWNSLQRSDTIHLNSTEICVKVFELNKKETDEHLSSLERMIEMNNNVMKHIKNLDFACDHDFCRYSLPILADFINDVTKLRKNAKNQSVCEYEFLKFCEFYYQTLFFIMKRDRNIQLNFFRFSNECIYPLLNQLIDILYRSKLKYFHKTKTWRFSNIRKMSDQERRHSLIHFLITFLEHQNITISTNEIDPSHSTDNLIFLCINIFSRFSLCNQGFKSNFILKFQNQKYLLSKQFINHLFTNGQVAGLSFECRIKLRSFIRYNTFSDLEEIFLERGMICPVFDVINRYSITFNLISITYPRNL